MKISNRNLRLCVLRRFLDRQDRSTGTPVLQPEYLRQAANDIELLDAELGGTLHIAFRARKVPMPIDDAMAIIDLWLRKRIDP